MHLQIKVVCNFLPCATLRNGIDGHVSQPHGHCIQSFKCSPQNTNSLGLSSPAADAWRKYSCEGIRSHVEASRLQGKVREEGSKAGGSPSDHRSCFAGLCAQALTSWDPNSQKSLLPVTVDKTSRPELEESSSRCKYPQPIIPFRNRHQLGTKCASMWAYRRDFSFKPLQLNTLVPNDRNGSNSIEIVQNPGQTLGKNSRNDDILWN